MSRARQLVERADEWLAAARLSAEEGHVNAAYESARKAAELAGKARLEAAGIEYPKAHAIQGLLYQHGFIPPGVDARALSRLLSDYTRGTYGFNEPLRAEELEQALEIAGMMIDAAQSHL